MLDIAAAALRANRVEFVRLGGQVHNIYVYYNYIFISIYVYR